jgi:hypothetical protein
MPKFTLEIGWQGTWVDPRKHTTPIFHRVGANLVEIRAALLVMGWCKAFAGCSLLHSFPPGARMRENLIWRRLTVQNCALYALRLLQHVHWE